MPIRERIRVKGSEFVQTIKDLVKQDNVGRICITYEEKRIFEIPLLAGDPAAPANVIKEPLLAALNAFGALINECELEVERVEKTAKKPAA